MEKIHDRNSLHRSYSFFKEAQEKPLIKQSHIQPPNWDKLVSLFGVEWGKTVVTYGDTCYCKDKLSLDLEVHESIHCIQQTNPEKWWERYYIDPAFRLNQELEAYKEQYRFMRKAIKDRNVLFIFRAKIAGDLSGKMYGNIIKFDEAYKLIG